MTDVAVSGTLDLDRMPLAVVPAQNPDGMSRFATLVKGNATVWTVASDAQVLLRYASEPYRSGYVTPENLARFAGAPLVAGSP